MPSPELQVPTLDIATPLWSLTRAAPTQSNDVGMGLGGRGGDSGGWSGQNTEQMGLVGGQVKIHSNDIGMGLVVGGVW